MKMKTEIKKLIAVGSGKGGVRKTTVSVNLAIALSRLGYKVGIPDGDIQGPNVPRMMATTHPPLFFFVCVCVCVCFFCVWFRDLLSGGRHPAAREERRTRHVDGIGQTRGGAVDHRRGALRSIFQKLLTDVDWGGLDYLVIDLPPGTGDVQMALFQSMPVAGAMVVTTPSEVSLEDTRKAIHMFQQMSVPILGLVENMSYLECPCCKECIDLLGRGAGHKTAETMGIHFLGEVPIDRAVRIGGDTGQPVTLGESGAGFVAIARRVESRVADIADKKRGCAA